MTSKFPAAITDCQMETFDLPIGHGQQLTSSSRTDDSGDFHCDFPTRGVPTPFCVYICVATSVDLELLKTRLTFSTLSSHQCVASL